MSKLENFLDELLIFMSAEIENKASTLNHIEFNFRISFTKTFFNAQDEFFEDGDDLKKFKTIIKLKDDDIVKQILMKAINEKYIKDSSGIGGNEFLRIYLTDKGFMKSKAIKLNKNENKKKFLTYPIEKLIIPILVSLVSAFMAAYITSNIQNETLNNKILNLKKDIEWIKQNK